MATTQTGILIRLCDRCGVTHPISRKHCAKCQRASLFLDPATGTCRLCQPKPESDDA